MHFLVAPAIIATVILMGVGVYFMVWPKNVSAWWYVAHGTLVFLFWCVLVLMVLNLLNAIPEFKNIFRRN